MSITLPSFEIEIYTAWPVDSDTLLLFLPWYLDGGNYAHMKWHREYFDEKWYFAISFDPPATFNSPWDISLYTITNYLKAIQEIIEHYNKKDVIIIWHSLGGAMAVLSAKMILWIKAFVSIMAPYSFDQYADKFQSSAWQKTWLRYSKRDIDWYDETTKIEYTVPFSFVEDAGQYELVSFLQSTPIPKLFIAWLLDNQVPSVIVESAYNLSAEPKKYEVVASEHNYRLSHTSIWDINNSIDSFISSL